ncbi:MAG: TraR/DksA family transcriptional regulator [Bacteroidetes bacterium]|jgi:RNA polymerase-binding transcription factor DksA|nr:TraR/DksA family transcriptional regulator [Bacteroidota bacterium]
MKTRYADEDLKEFEALIDKKLERAQSQLGYYEKLLRENENGKVKGMDDSALSVENESAVKHAGRMRKHIQHLEKAKERIHKKTYGICRETGKLISKNRLLAVPHATLSIEAKQKRTS